MSGPTSISLGRMVGMDLVHGTGHQPANTVGDGDFTFRNNFLVGLRAEKMVLQNDANHACAAKQGKEQPRECHVC